MLNAKPASFQRIAIGLWLGLVLLWAEAAILTRSPFDREFWNIGIAAALMLVPVAIAALIGWRARGFWLRTALRLFAVATFLLALLVFYDVFTSESSTAAIGVAMLPILELLVLLVLAVVALLADRFAGPPKP